VHERERFHRDPCLSCSRLPSSGSGERARADALRLGAHRRGGRRLRLRTHPERARAGGRPADPLRIDGADRRRRRNRPQRRHRCEPRGRRRPPRRGRLVARRRARTARTARVRPRRRLRRRAVRLGSLRAGAAEPRPPPAARSRLAGGNPHEPRPHARLPRLRSQKGQSPLPGGSGRLGGCVLRRPVRGRRGRSRLSRRRAALRVPATRRRDDERDGMQYFRVSAERLLAAIAAGESLGIRNAVLRDVLVRYLRTRQSLESAFLRGYAAGRWSSFLEFAAVRRDLFHRLDVGPVHPRSKPQASIAGSLPVARSQRAHRQARGIVEAHGAAASG
jgi:hypothetical protein